VESKLMVAPVVFFCIAFVFSMLGMGGAQLYIPVLFWLGMDFKAEAIPLGLLLNVVNSSSAGITYLRERLVSWRVGLPFAAAMLLLPPVGARVNAQLAVKPIIALFALFTAVAAVLMLTGWKPGSRGLSRSGQLAVGGLGGGALGFLVGLIGRGGGSFVVPLLYVCGLAAKNAAATSAVVVTGSALSGFLSHLPTATLHPRMTLVTAASVLLGSQVGSRLMARKMKSRAVKLVFGIVLLGVATALLIQGVLLG
jgi:uncharacterized membrane protein YfcA